MPILTPFQGDFLVRVVPKAEALGCSLFALRAIGTRTRKCPNSTGGACNLLHHYKFFVEKFRRHSLKGKDLMKGHPSRR